MVERIGFSSQVPGNVSRYFNSAEEAMRQPLGRIELAWEADAPLMFNEAFDSTLIHHDIAYFTTSAQINGQAYLPTLEYFDAAVAPFINRHASVIDIGCGQGELVNWLRAAGLDATGYDPVIRRPTRHLFRKYWSPTEPAADLYIMRCVLPHIPSPWDFLRLIARSNESAFVLIEYQRLEFVLEEGLWFQLSHDHVNQFQLRDFSDRFSVLAHGTFAEAEWQWVLIQPSVQQRPPCRPFAFRDAVSELSRSRERALQRLAAQDRPLAIWGAAGKGVVIAQALNDAGVDSITMIDADPNKAGLFVEASGARILSPLQALSELNGATRVLVANPRHFVTVARLVGHRFDVTTAAEWGRA